MAEAAATEMKPSIPLFGRERPKPGRYYLDLDCVWKMPMRWNAETSTFGEVYQRLHDAKPSDDPSGYGLENEAFATPD